MEHPHKYDGRLCEGYRQGQAHRMTQNGQTLRNEPTLTLASQSFDDGFDSTTPLFLRETDIYETQ